MNEMNEQNDTQYLTFLLSGEVYGIGILHVKEIIEFKDVTDVPMTPGFIRGVINLRGNVVPVVDLGVRFGRDIMEATIKSCIVILETEYEQETVVIGALVDAVDEVLDIPESKIEAAPQFGTSIRADFISGVGVVDDKFILLLKKERVIDLDELSAIERLSGRSERQAVMTAGAAVSGSVD